MMHTAAQIIKDATGMMNNASAMNNAAGMTHTAAHIIKDATGQE